MSHHSAGPSGLLPLIGGIVYGPVSSRRLGCSLGVNLLPQADKTCSFNCIYCQYGWTTHRAVDESAWPSPACVAEALAAALGRLPDAEAIDRVTLAGHGEPTLHPDFPAIVAAVRKVRDRLIPSARLAVLSNGTQLGDTAVREAMHALDERYVKLDAGDQPTLRRVNASARPLPLLIAGIKSLPDVILQSMFVDDPAGRCGNASHESLEAWLRAVCDIHPKGVHLYTLARNPALARLRPVPRSVLDRLATDLGRAGIHADVFD